MSSRQKTKDSISAIKKHDNDRVNIQKSENFFKPNTFSKIGISHLFLKVLYSCRKKILRKNNFLVYL